MKRERSRRRVPTLLIAALPLVLCSAALYLIGGVDLKFLAGFFRSLSRPPLTVTVPQGVAVAAWATGLTTPTSITFGPDGRMYVAELSGEVVALSDKDGDGRAEARQTFASGIPSPLGLAFRGNDLYVGRRGGVDVACDSDGDGAANEIKTLISNLPAGRHQTDGLAFGPDGRLYFSAGSRSDRGELPIDLMEASILVANADGTGLRVFASGTRNPYDLAFNPDTGDLFATDNGRDVPTTGVPDELNHIIDGGDYGWPQCWGQVAGDECRGTIGPAAEFQEHSSADGMVFYTGAMFPQWRNNAFVALYGANSRDPDIGRVVKRVELSQASDGSWSGAVKDFAAGFANPIDVTVGPDGALYVADFGSGIIYRFFAL
ncbi:MAG: PQQ-dependent sugar dehydrogenase [Chloroflexi bacterium]|nr:PQQ-dependent sugar dehydrogenase [Chloroflexota bacterium]